MPLTADYTKIENYEEVVLTTDDEGNKQLRGLTHGLCMIGMVIGMSDLTKKNLETWYERICMYEILNGPFFRYEDEDAGMTRDLLKTHIGLKLNVSPMSKAAFKNQIYKMLKQKVRDKDRARERLAS